MADVFLSYSRRDSEFVRRLADALEARGKDVWVDIEGIRDGEIFPAALRSAVEGSDGFVFVISPDAVDSKFCRQEVDHAVESGKRIVPLVHRRVPDEEVPDAIRERNWIPFEEAPEFDPGIERLVTALDTDLEHAKAHTRWLVKALEWDSEGRDRSFLLRGAELAAAERWLGDAAGKDPEPTSVQHEYVYASRAAASRRLRLLAAAMAVAFAVAVALAVVALTQRNAARHQSAIARSRELAAVSENQLQIDPELAALIGIEAVKKQASPQAMLALREALDALALRKTLRGHHGGVTAVAWSPDGRLLASTAPDVRDVSVRIWDARTGHQLHVIYPNGRPRKAPLLPPGGGPPGAAPVVLPKGQRPRGAPAPGGRLPNTVAFSPDGKLLAVGLDSGGIAFYDPATGRLRTRVGGPNDHVDRITFSADGRFLLASGVGAAVLGDVRALRPVRKFRLVRKGNIVLDSALSPDARLVAGGAPGGGAVWDARTGALLHPLPGNADGVAFSPTSQVLALAFHDGRIELMASRTGKVLRTIANVAPAGPNHIAWSPDGTRLAAGLTDGTARIWDVASGRQLQRFAGHRCCVLDVAFSPDGKLLATGAEDDHVNIWSSRGNALDTLQASRAQITGVAFTANGSVAITDVRGGTLLWKPGQRPTRLPAGGRVSGVVASPDGRTLAIPGPGTRVTLIAAATNAVERTIAAPSAVQSLAFDPSGRLVAIASKRGITVVSAATGAPAGRQQQQQIAADHVAFAPRGELLEALPGFGNGDSGELWVMSRQTGKLLKAIPSAGPYTAIADSPTGALFAAVARSDPGIRIFDGKTYREVRELLGHVSDVSTLAWTPDGRLLASGGFDGTVRVWNPATGDELRTIQHGAPIYALAFNHDGSQLAFGDSGGSVEVWAGCPGCSDPKALLALARRAVTRPLTALERRTFLGH